MNKLKMLSYVVAALVAASAARADAVGAQADIELHKPKTKKEKPIVNRPPHSPETVWEEQRLTGS